MKNTSAKTKRVPRRPVLSDAVGLKVYINILIFWGVANTLAGQNTLSSDAAVATALQTHPLAKAAAFEVQAKKYGEKQALNLPNPELNVESPTGEFYTLGVTQSFDFPTVYKRQKRVAKAATKLARAGQLVQENDLRYTVRLLYLETQVADYQKYQWTTRDSLYQSIAAAATRQFAAGEIDFLQKTLAENEAAEVHQDRLSAEQTALSLQQKLAKTIGLSEPILLQPLHADTLGLSFAPNATSYPMVVQEQMAAQVAEQQVALAKSRALPNVSLGYMNQGARNSPLDYRFRASLGVPLWAGQYRAGQQAAEAQAQAAQSRVKAEEMEAIMALDKLQRESRLSLARLQYLEKEALPRSRALINAAIRMHEAGQIDYATLLRSLDQAADAPRDYISQLKSFNTMVLQMRYLAGE